MELKYALLSYGIAPQILPLDDGCHLDHDQFLADIKQRRSVETQRRRKIDDLNIIDHPTRFDILLGRGRPYQDFPGNIRLSQVVEMRMGQYETKHKSEKTTIAIDIVHTIKAMGGRFLKRVSQYDETAESSWEEVDFAIAHKKVSSSFRTRKRIKGAGSP